MFLPPLLLLLVLVLAFVLLLDSRIEHDVEHEREHEHEQEWKETLTRAEIGAILEPSPGGLICLAACNHPKKS